MARVRDPALFAVVSTATFWARVYLLQAVLQLRFSLLGEYSENTVWAGSDGPG